MSNSLIEAVRAIAPNAIPSSTTTVIRKQRDTIDDARRKVIDKLNRSISYVDNGMEFEDGVQIDLVFKAENDDTFLVGAKYGNRWLPNLFDKKQPSFRRISETQLVGVMKAIVQKVDSGDCDEDLQLIQATNAKGKRRKVA